MPGRVESWTTMRATPSEEARMRGEGTGSEPHMWSYVPLERRIPSDHPLRPLRAMGDTILGELSPQFDQLYSKVGRPSIPPEHLLRALLLQVLYSVRSERLLMEQLDYNLLFRWFVGLAMDDPIWDATVFTKNRERLLRGDIARAFFERVRAQAEQRGLLSDEHFTVDGTLIDAWASLKSFQRKDAPPTTPHVAQNTSNRSSAIDRRTTRHAGYEVSQQKRKRIEEVFGWLKTIGLLRQTRHRGRRRVGWMFVFSLAVYNLVRIRNLAECPA